MNYKILGGTSMGLLIVAIVLSVFILTGRHSKKLTTIVSFTVLALMLIVSGLCYVIYNQYGG
jgi:hypothetical protein